MAEVTRKGDRIEIGETVRIESGPAMRRRKATAEALDNGVTAPHYQLGAPDAMGQAIEEGKMFSYLDYQNPPVFYVFERVQIGADDPRYKPQPDPTAPPLNDDSTNIASYSYVFEERGTFATEDAAIEAGQTLAGGE